MITLATSKWFYTHGLETLIIIAILFTLIGLLVGWLAWRNCQTQANLVESLNADLRKNVEAQNKLRLAAKKLS